jgi:3-oxoacyl-[acyl-carrier-protein] synthase-3
MYFERPVHVAACGAYLPSTRITTAEALARGYITERDRAEADYQAIAVEEELYPGAMAARAARTAVGRAAVAPEEIDLVVYASNHRHGHRHFWSPASYVQRAVEARRAFAFNVSAGCTAQVAMSDLAAAYLLADPRRRAAVVVAADRHSGSPVNRWTGDFGIFFGDGAAAVVYSRSPGVARVLCVNTRTVAELEEVHRLEAEHAQTSETWAGEYDVRETKRRFIAKHGAKRLSEVTNEVTDELFQLSLAEAGLAPRDISRLVLPNLGRKLMEATYFRFCEGQLDRCLWPSVGRSIGHVGPADQILGLNHLLETESVRPGELLALMGAGAGFSWSCMIVEVLPHDRSRAAGAPPLPTSLPLAG